MFDLLALGGEAGFDRDPAWLHRLRHLTHQVDLQKPVLERGALHLDVVGQAELTPERTEVLDEPLDGGQGSHEAPGV